MSNRDLETPVSWLNICGYIEQWLLLPGTTGLRSFILLTKHHILWCCTERWLSTTVAKGLSCPQVLWNDTCSITCSYSAELHCVYLQYILIHTFWAESGPLVVNWGLLNLTSWIRLRTIRNIFCYLWLERRIMWNVCTKHHSPCYLLKSVVLELVNVTLASQWPGYRLFMALRTP
jgi:hypothetical protein